MAKHGGAAVAPHTGILRDFDGMMLHPGPEIEAGDRAVTHGDTLRFYSRSGRCFATYERRGGAWWVKR